MNIDFAVKGLVIKDNKYLIVHKSDVPGDVWELPGGRMKFGETSEETLVREIKEESGYDVEPLQLLDTWNYIRHDNQITGVMYLCKIIDGVFQLSDEHDMFQWLSLGDKSVEKLALPFKERMEKWDWELVKSTFNKNIGVNNEQNYHKLL